jgi:N-acetylmuramoyl-L-alanine amidase/outer membrane biosynthesis protein TonB
MSRRPHRSRRGIRGAVRRPWLVAVVALVAQVIFVALPASAAGASIADTVAVASVSPRVFFPNGDGVADTTTLHYELSRSATVSVSIRDDAGHALRTLRTSTAQAPGGYDVAWNGRNSGGGLAPDAGYRFRLTVANGLGTFSVDRWLTKARHAIYPQNPGAITVAIDAGHGGPDPGAVRGSAYEKTANLGIALRLRAMLIGAGVKVVMTRTGDTRVNRGQIDWTRDGVVAYRDELASRIEIANAARADVFLALHNNGTPPGVGGTETWYDRTRTFASTNRTLATTVQSQLMAFLRTLRTSAWYPTDRGVKAVDFYVLRSYKPGFCDRPTLMPGILPESLAMGSPYEVRLMESSRGQQVIAEAYYEALVRFFATRTWGARYDLISAPPASANEGSAQSTRLRVTNTSPRAWADGAVSLTLSSVAAVPWYDGSNAPGTRLATVVLPALAAGASTEVDVPFTVPAYAAAAARGGATILKVDLSSGTTRLATAGVPPLQRWMTIVRVAPPPTPTPSETPAPTDGPTPTPTDGPTAAPTEAPTAAPTESPTAAPTESPTAAPTESPTAAPTESPTAAPTESPTAAPTESPTAAPTESPTATPTDAPVPAASD